jgi:hypothetical protein
MRRHDAAVAAAEARERAVEHCQVTPQTWISGYTGGAGKDSISNLMRCPHCNGLDVAPRSLQRRFDGPTMVKGADGDVIWEETFVFAGPGGHDERETEATATGPTRIVGICFVCRNCMGEFAFGFRWQHDRKGTTEDVRPFY